MQMLPYIRCIYQIIFLLYQIEEAATCNAASGTLDHAFSHILCSEETIKSYVVLARVLTLPNVLSVSVADGGANVEGSYVSFSTLSIIGFSHLMFHSFFFGWKFYCHLGLCRLIIIV